MSIIRYLPKWVNDFDENLVWPASQSSGLNIRETDKDIIIRAIVAGVPSNDVDANIENGVLTIKAEAKDEEKSKDEYKTSSYQYYYTAALSGGDWPKAEADVNNGILTITIPKAEAAKPRKITIKTK